MTLTTLARLTAVIAALLGLLRTCRLREGLQ